MKITRISKLGNKGDRFAIFIDDKYSLALSAQTILDKSISPGQEITSVDLDDLKHFQLNNDLYNRSLRYVSIRLRSEAEMRAYLKRKEATQDQIKAVIKKLKLLDLINDKKYADAYIHDKLILSSSSKRKLTYELRKKEISEDIISTALDNSEIDDSDSLKHLINQKRSQSKYKDDLKLMQYLVRRGYNYGDVKNAMNALGSGSANLD